MPRALEGKVARRGREQAKKAAAELGEFLSRKSGEEWARAIRKDRAVDFLAGQTTLGSAYYEVGNAILKEVGARGGKQDAGAKLKKLAVVLEQMKTHDIRSEDELKAVLEVGEKLGLTFYDASYAYLATRLGAQLVTEDVELREKASGLSSENLQTRNEGFDR